MVMRDPNQCILWLGTISGWRRAKKKMEESEEKKKKKKKLKRGLLAQ